MDNGQWTMDNGLEMKTLFIDIASRQALIAAVTVDAVVASSSSDERVGDAELIPMIEKVLKEAGWEYTDLERIACVIGPGGFTSLRVGVTCANVLADQLKIPLAGVHLSDVCAACALFAAEEPWDEMSIAWIHSTKKNEVFIRGFGLLTEQWPEATYALLEDVLAHIPEGTMWIGELVEEHQEKIAQSGCQQLTEILQAAEVLPLLLDAREYTQDQLEPWYGRGY